VEISPHGKRLVVATKMALTLATQRDKSIRWVCK
jgi:hypothetical protein